MDFTCRRERRRRFTLSTVFRPTSDTREALTAPGGNFACVLVSLEQESVSNLRVPYFRAKVSSG